MDVRLPDGTVIRGVPDGMSKADLTAKLARNGYDVSKLGGPAPGQIPNTPGLATTQNDIDNATRLQSEGTVKPNRDGILGRIGGAAETVASLGSGMLSGMLGNVYGVGKSVADGQFGTQAGVQAAQKTAEEYAARNTYQPRTDTGKLGVQQFAAAAAPLHDLVGIPIPELNAAARAASSSAGAVRNLAGANAAAVGAQDAAAAAGAGKLSDLVRAPKPAMPGVGAAETAEATLRAQRFANMRAPMKPTKGILTRSIDDVQFEREAAKRPEGKALDNRFAELNEGMGQHMDALIDETGATASSARATGKAVTSALETKKAAKKQEINAAYKAARESGEMAELVDVGSLGSFVEKNRAAAKNAPVISAIEDEVQRLSGGSGKISVNDMEELRKMVGKLSEPGTPNSTFGKEAMKLIDQATDGKGGPAYQQARRLYENYSKEFKDRDVVDRLLRTKRGTKDRAVAYEDVADSILLDGSLDDMKHAFRVLEAHPKGTAPEVVAAGQQAAKELRGAAAAKLKERMFSNAGADSKGNVVGSEAQIKRIVNELDKDGKLEYLFGKKGAEEIRDTVQVATDLYSTPKGTVNSSNTASAMEKILDKMAGTFGGTPVFGHAIKYGAKKLESRNYTKRVNAALEPAPPPPRAPQLNDMTGDR